MTHLTQHCLEAVFSSYTVFTREHGHEDQQLAQDAILFLLQFSHKWITSFQQFIDDLQ